MLQGMQRADFARQRGQDTDAEEEEETELLPDHDRSGICHPGYAAPTPQALHGGELMFAKDGRLRLTHGCAAIRRAVHVSL